MNKPLKAFLKEDLEECDRVVDDSEIRNLVKFEEEIFGN